MKTSVLAILAAAALANLAQADVITAAYSGRGQGRSIAIQSPGIDGTVFAGQLFHTLSGGTGDLAQYNGTWTTFCTDLFQYVSSTPRTYDLVTLDLVPNAAPMGAAKANAIAHLYTFAGGSQLLSTATNDYAAAFQLAVWEVVYDFNPAASNNGLNVTGGAFRATASGGGSLNSTITSHLVSFFNAASSEGPAHADLIGIRSSAAQDQIIPIPSAGPIALAALGGLCLVRRRSK
jgi:hypothetical protein